MNNSHQCKFIHSEQIERWFKYYLKYNNIDMLLKYIFLEIVRSLDKQFKYKANQIAEQRRLHENEERRLMDERRRYNDRFEIRRESRERSRSRERERERRYDDRSSYQSRPSLLPPPSISATRSDPRLELEKINLEIELAKKKKELLEISKATDSLKTKLDVETMVKSAIASQMQTVAASYSSAYPSQVYQHYGGYAGGSTGAYAGAGAGGYAGAGVGAGVVAGASAGGYDPRFAYDSRSAYTGVGAAYGSYSEY